MFEISPPAAIALSLGISLLIAAGLQYVAVVERTQTALRYWSLAFASHALHDAVLLPEILGFAPLDFLAPACLALMTGFLWAGLHRTTGAPMSRKIPLLLALASLWSLVPTPPGFPPSLRTLPVEILCTGLCATAGVLFWRRAKAVPGTGHRLSALALLAWSTLLAAAALDIARDGSPLHELTNNLLLLALGFTLTLNALRLQQAHEGTISAELRAEIARRQSAEEALARSHERFGALAEASSLGIFVVAPDGRFQYTNPRYRIIAGLTPSELATQPDLARFAPEDRDPVATAWSEARQEIHQTHYERRVFQDNGSIGWISVHVAPILVGGVLTGFVGTAEDITRRKETEQALRDSEARFSQVFQFLPDVVTLSDPRDARLVDMNRHWSELLGYSRAETLGHSGAELGLWAQPADATAIFEDLAIGAEVISRPVTLHHRDGHPVECLLRARMLRIGQRDFVLTVIRDVSAQRRLEEASRDASEALRVSEAMFSAAFHSSPDYITISRLADGSILEVNHAFEQLTGWTREQTIGTSGVELGLWAQWEEREAMVRHVSEHGSIRDFPCTLSIRTGERRSCLLNAATVSIENQPCLIGIVRDVTEQNAAAEALRESQQKFATIFNSVPFALSLTRIEDRTHVDANPAWEKLFGLQRETVLARTTGEFGFWVDREAYNTLYERIAQRETIEQHEILIQPLDRSAIATCLISGQRLRINNEECALWSMVDITELRRIQGHIEELNHGLEIRVAERTAELTAALDTLHQTQEELIRSEKLAALGSLVAGIAHELNTPIGNCVTVATTLGARSEELAGAQASGTLRRSTFEAYLNSIRTATDLLMRSLTRARELVRSFKQVAVDQTSEQRRHFELGEVLREVLITLGPMFRGRPYTIEIRPSAPVEMESYPGPLGQVLTNLVNNALVHAFSDRDHGHITIQVEEQAGDQVEIRFSDDGNGIESANLRRIFDPFFTTRLGAGGSGLGLHIVYNLVTRVLGGRLNVTSEPGQGTCFILRLPRTAPVNSHHEKAMGVSAEDRARTFNFEDSGPII